MGVELGVAFCVVDALVGAGFVAFTTRQTNFFPLFTHFNETLPDLETVPTLGQGFPGDLVTVLEAAIAIGAASTASATSAVMMMRDDLLWEAFMKKTVPAKEC